MPKKIFILKLVHRILIVINILLFPLVGELPEQDWALRLYHLLLIVCRFIVLIIASYIVEGVKMDIVKLFKTNVKRYRQAMGISQEAFAEKCGLHRTYISAI